MGTSAAQDVGNESVLSRQQDACPAPDSISIDNRIGAADSYLGLLETVMELARKYFLHRKR